MATTPNRGYQLPAASSKLKDDVLRLMAALGAIDTDVAGLLTALAGKSDLGHGHAMAEITGLVAALGNKLDVGYHDALANLTDVDVAGVANGMALLRQASKWIPVALQINNIAGLETALNGKATTADITAAIDNLVGAAPGALDTLVELSSALGNDPNFATTVTNAIASAVPAGAVMSFARNTAPTGWLKANGAAVSRTTYAALFAAIGTTFGAGNGSTTFNVPDLRGEFLRGWDDGRGVDSGRAFGSAQADQNEAHTHTGSAASGGAHTHTGSAASAGAHQHESAIGHAGGITYGTAYRIDAGFYGGATSDTVTSSSAGAHTHSVTVNSGGAHTHTLTIDSQGGSEARPRNVALLACIKY